MAIQYVGGSVFALAGSVSTSANVSLTGLTGGIGTEPIEGDLIIVGVSFATQGRNASCKIQGWDTIGAQLNETGVVYDTLFNISYQFAGATPPTEVTTPPSGNAGDAKAVIVHVFRGVDPTTPFDGVTPVSAKGTGKTNPNPPAIVANSLGAFVVAIGAGAMGGSPTAFTSSDLTNFRQIASNSTNDSVIGGGHVPFTGNFSVDVAEFGGGNTNANFSWAAWTFALKPANYPSPNGKQVEFTFPGTYYFFVPDGVTEISAVTIGGGGGGNAYVLGGSGGAGGDLRYVSNVTVTPGDMLTVTVGSGGVGTAGQESNVFIGETRIVSAAGGGFGQINTGSSAKNGTSQGTGGNGGIGSIKNANGVAGGGGGAGGYSGNGGAGSGASGIYGSGGIGYGGGAGGGGSGSSSYGGGGAGGGVGIYGAGASGTGGAGSGGVGGGGGGSGGSDGTSGTNGTTTTGGTGGLFGGGGGARASGSSGGGSGGSGAVRIIWGAGRFYPSTNTADQFPPIEFNAESGSFSTTGSDSTLRHNRAIATDAGTFTTTGADASLVRKRILQADAGSFTSTGQDASLTFRRNLVADAGSFTTSGAVTTLAYRRSLDAASGTFQTVGADATLTYQQVNSYVLDVSVRPAPSCRAPAVQAAMASG